jgi:hypothetical protein
MSWSRVHRIATVASFVLTLASCSSAQNDSAAAGAEGGQDMGPNTLAPAERAAGWRLLFDGRTTQGWKRYKSAEPITGWEAVDGTLTRTGAGGDIITTDQFRNFELALEWRLAPDGPPGNSGIFYRAVETTDAIYWGAPEMQVLDNARHPDGRSELTSAGSNFALHGVPQALARPAGEWNAVRLIVNGNHVEHWLNGAKVVEYELGSFDWKARVAKSKFASHPEYGRAERGHIGLQEHGSYVAFRNIRILELP